MPSQSSTKVSGVKQDKAKVKTPDRAPQASQSSAEVQPALPVELVADSIESQIAMLKQMSARQSQAFLLQISRQHGNQHVQRLVTHLTSRKSTTGQPQGEKPCVGCPEEGKQVQRSSTGEGLDLANGKIQSLQRKAEEPCVGCPEEGPKIQRTNISGGKGHAGRTNQSLQRETEVPCEGCPEEAPLVQRTGIGSGLTRATEPQIGTGTGSVAGTQEAIEPDREDQSQGENPATTSQEIGLSGISAVNDSPKLRDKLEGPMGEKEGGGIGTLGTLKDKLEISKGEKGESKKEAGDQARDIIEDQEETKQQTKEEKKPGETSILGAIGEIVHGGSDGTPGQSNGRLRERMEELPGGNKESTKDQLAGPGEKEDKKSDAIAPAKNGAGTVIKDKLETAGGGGQDAGKITKEKQEVADQTAKEIVKTASQSSQVAKDTGEQGKSVAKVGQDQIKQAVEEIAAQTGEDKTGQAKEATQGAGLAVKETIGLIKGDDLKKNGPEPALRVKSKAAKIPSKAQENKNKLEPVKQPAGQLRDTLEETSGEKNSLSGAGDGLKAQIPDEPLDELKGGSLREAITENLNKFLEQPPAVDPAPKGDLLTRQPPKDLVQREVSNPLEWARGILNSLRSDASGKKQNIQSAKGSKTSQLNSLSTSKAGQLRSQSAPMAASFSAAGQSASAGATSAVTASNQQVKTLAAAQSSQATGVVSQKEQQISSQISQSTEALKQEGQAVESKGHSKLELATEETTSLGESLQDKASLQGEQEQSNWKSQEQEGAKKVEGITKEADGLFKLLQIKAAAEGPSAKGDNESAWSNFTESKGNSIKEIESEGDKKIEESKNKNEGLKSDSPMLGKWLEGTPEKEISAELDADVEAVTAKAETTGSQLRSAAEGTANDFANVKNSLQTGITASVEAARQGLKSTTDTAKNAVSKAGKTTVNNVKQTGKTVVNSVGNTGKAAKQAMKSVVDAAKSGLSGKGGSIMRFFGSMVRSIIGGVKSVGQSAYQGVKDTFNSVKNTVKNAARSVVDGIKQVVAAGKSSLAGVIESIKSGARAIWESTKTLAANTASRISEAAQNIFELVSSAIKTGLTFIKQKIAQVRDLIKAGIAALKEKVKAIYEAIKEKALALWNELKSRWQAFKNKLKQTWEKIKGLARTIIYKACGIEPDKENQVDNEKKRVEKRRKVGDKDWTFNPEDVVKENYKGMGTPQLGNAMKDMVPFIKRGASRKDMKPDEQAKLDAVLAQVAKARGMSLADAQKQYDQAIKVKSEAKAVAKAQGKEYEYETPLENKMHSDFWGSKEQLAFGNIVGDNLGLDPVFGSLLSPTGGLVGPGSNALHLKDSAIGYHGIAHDAAGYLKNFHKIGPGYQYKESPDWDPTKDFKTSDPLAGQVSGIHWWSQQMKGTKDEKKLAYLNPEITNVKVAGVNVGIRLEIGLDKEVVNPEDMGPLDYLDLDLFARLRCSASKAGVK